MVRMEHEINPSQDKPLTEEYQRKADERYEQLLSEYDTSETESAGLHFLWEQGKKSQNVTKDTQKLDK